MCRGSLQQRSTFQGRKRPFFEWQVARRPEQQVQEDRKHVESWPQLRAPARLLLVAHQLVAEGQNFVACTRLVTHLVLGWPAQHRLELRAKTS